MEINYKNGELVGEQNYFTTNEGIISNLILNNGIVNFEQLPKLHTIEGLDLRYLNYGSKTFVVAKDTAKELSHFFMYEQKLKGDKLEVLNYDYSMVIPNNHILAPLLNNEETNEVFVDKSVKLLLYYLNHMNYALNTMSIYNQIVAFLNEKLEQKVASVEVAEIPFEEVEYKNEEPISVIAKRTGIPYNTLWGRIRDRHMTVEEAIKLGSNRAKIKAKKKHPDVIYEGKNLKELSKEYGIKYNKLWDRVHRQGRTVEEALAMGNGKKGGNK